MRRRIGLSCAALSCLGSTLVAVTSCEDSSSEAPAVDGGASPDVRTPDTYVPPVPPLDAGPDAIVDAGGCTPGSLAGFTVPAYVPARSQMFVCPPEIWPPLAEACVGDASTLASCADYNAKGNDGGPIDPSCATCLDPANVDAGLGPLVKGSVVTANVAGCVELADPTDAGFDCARAIAAAAACVEHVCKPSCPVTDEPSRAAYLACAKLAATGACVSYTQAATACIATELDGGSQQLTNFCFPPDAGPVVQFSQIARYFCYS